jgi:hypothetical protein
MQKTGAKVAIPALSSLPASDLERWKDLKAGKQKRQMQCSDIPRPKLIKSSNSNAMSNNQAIMISYKTENRATADELFAMLEAVGLVPWMDYRGIEPGMRWRDELIRQVRTCNAFVALLTPNYIRSEHCRMEILIARSRRCPILPVEVEECIDLLDSYEETKGLADTFMVRLQRSSLVGLPISREQALERLVSSALSIDQTPSIKKAYIAYCNNEAAVATQIASQLEQAGIST